MTGLEITIMRIREGLHQWEVASELGFSSAWLSKLERGRNPLTPDVAKSIVAAIEKLAGTPINEGEIVVKS